MAINKLNKIGWWIYAPFLLFTARLTWEKTYLTWMYGKQNLGFALAHGYFSLLVSGTPDESHLGSGSRVRLFCGFQE